MNRNQALPFVSFCVDDALSERNVADMPANARLIGWQCGFEPLFVAVWSYLDCLLDADEAIELATDLLSERHWFAGDEVREPDYVI